MTATAIAEAAAELSPARWPRAHPLDERLLHVDRVRVELRHLSVRDFPSLLAPGDLVVLNDAATLPASLRAGDRELRLAGATLGGTFRAVVMGDGDWRTPTERRHAPPPLLAGERLRFGGELFSTVELTAVVERVSPISPRLIELRFDREGAALWSALYRLGRPVQYSYLAGPLELWHTQTAYAARPWAVEQPSAGRPLSLSLLGEIRRRGAALATVTHAAGLSSTGDPAIDAALPLPERYDVPRATVEAVAAARRVIAVGTTVVRALEGAAASGELRAGEGETDLTIHRGFRPRVVRGLYTGLHQPGSNHFELLSAFAPVELLERAHAEAQARGYLGHEFGDSCLLL